MPEKLKPAKVEEVPLSREGRVSGVMELPNKNKKAFLPPEGFEFQIGPFIYVVSSVNVGDMRFSARIHDFIVEGVND